MTLDMSRSVDDDVWRLANSRFGSAMSHRGGVMGTAELGGRSRVRAWLVALVASVVATGGDVAVNVATAIGRSVLAWSVVGVLVAVGASVTVWLERREARATASAGSMAPQVTNAISGSAGGPIMQAGSIGGSVQVGDAVTGNKIVHYAPPPPAAPELTSVEDVSAPVGLCNLPTYPSMFVGRQDAVMTLNIVLGKDARRAVVQAVHGLGGVGKSTLAARWAADHQPPFHPLWWITADTPAALDAGLVGLASALEPALANALQGELLRDRAVAWLACHSGWLVVLDNVTVPKDIEWLVARVRTGRFLITSRHAVGWHQIATPIRLDVLDPADAVALATAVLTHDPDRRLDLDGAEALCAELGFLPLAVEQAAAYCSQAGTTPAGYLRLLADTPAAMVATVADGADPNRSVARVWRVTLDRLQTLDPSAGLVLRILAWWASTGIPRDLLDGLGSAVEVVAAVGMLAAHSMITLGGHSEIQVHPLVQAVSRTPDSADPHRQPADIDNARNGAVKALLTHLPDDHKVVAQWPMWRLLLPHVRALSQACDPATDDQSAADLYSRIGLFLLDQGQVATATEYRSRALAAYERILGPEHPLTLASRNNLGLAYQAAGDLTRAIPLHEQTLADCERVLGPDDLTTLATRNSLATAYESAGGLARAIPLYEQTLAYSERALGPEHPHTLATRNNLGLAYQAAGDPIHAILLHEQTLGVRQRVLGPDHPDTLNSRNNLAFAHRAAGNLAGAIPLYEQTLTYSERVLGPDHPTTLATRNNLAYAYKVAGDLARAVPLYEQTIAYSERVLGPDHPNTLRSRNNLARAHESAGDLDRAISLYEKILADAERVLGPDHPTTRLVRGNLDAARTASQ